MSETLTRPNKVMNKVMPSATPSEADIAAWNELTRDEQLRRMREYLSHPDSSTVSGDSMADILALAQGRAATRRNG